MDVCEAQTLRQLENENRRLKELVADLTPDKDTLGVVVGKKLLELAGMGAEVVRLRLTFGPSGQQVFGDCDVEVPVLIVEAERRRNVRETGDYGGRETTLGLSVASRVEPKWRTSESKQRLAGVSGSRVACETEEWQTAGS